MCIIWRTQKGPSRRNVSVIEPTDQPVGVKQGQRMRVIQ